MTDQTQPQQIDLSKMSENELLKFIIEQQKQKEQALAVLYQVSNNIQIAEGFLPKPEAV